MSAPAQARKPWSHRDAAREYHASHKYAPYSMAWNARLEAEARNPALSPVHRFMAAATLLSSGNLSDFITLQPPKKKGGSPQRPATQKELAARMGISGSVLSGAIDEAEKLGFCDRKDGGILVYDKCKERGSSEDENSGKTRGFHETDSDSQNSSSPYLRFKETYLSSHNTALAEAMSKKRDERERYREEARRCARELREMELVVLAAFRDWERKAETDSDSVNRGTAVDSDSAPDAILTPPPEIRGVRSGNAKKANVSAPNAGAPLNPSDLNPSGIESNSTAGPPSSSFSIAPETTTTTDPEPLSNVLDQQRIVHDAEAVETIVKRCKERDPAATIEEIAAETRNRAPQARTRQNPIGHLITYVPKAFPYSRRKPSPARERPPLPDWMPDSTGDARAALARADLPADQRAAIEAAWREQITAGDAARGAPKKGAAKP